MSLVYSHVVKCDYPQCNQTFSEFSTDLPARQWAAARALHGWGCRNTKKNCREHYCPTHAQKLKLPFGAPDLYTLGKMRSPLAEAPADPVVAATETPNA